MRFCFSIFLLCLLLSASPAVAGYTADTCSKAKAQNRVRADLVFDLATGKVLIEKNAGAVFHPASLTKLMSLAVVFDDLRAKKIKYTQAVTLVRAPGQIDNRTAKIKQMTVREAINGVATASLNNALDGLARLTGPESAFVARMNEKAKLWGMTKTLFANTTGWPTPASLQLQRTTLHDYARLLGALWTLYPQEMKEFSGKSEVRISGLPAPLKSTNHLLEQARGRMAMAYPGVIGGKTGYICYSGWHLITVFADKDLKGRRMVAMTVGHATGRARDLHMKELLDKGRPKLKTFVKEEERRIAREKLEAAKAEKLRIAAAQKAERAAQEAARKLAAQNAGVPGQAR